MRRIAAVLLCMMAVTTAIAQNAPKLFPIAGRVVSSGTGKSNAAVE